MEIIILGQGAWGRAIATLFQENNHAVSFLKKGEKIPSGSIVFSAIPTQALRQVLCSIEKPKKITFINGSKGIEQDTHLLPYQIVREVWGEGNYLTLMGPSFAEEIVERMPTLVNLGYRDIEIARKIKSLMQTDYFRIKLTKSVRSLEMSAAFKNVYAIACGVSEGLGYGVNTRVKLMMLALEEQKGLREALKFQIDDDALPASMGDLILTCSSNESRNFRFGKYLVESPPSEALRRVGATVEGFYTVESVPHLEKKLGFRLPLAHFVYVVTHKKSSNMQQQFVDFVKNI